MILDSSALIAILRGEPEQVDFLRLIDLAETVTVSAATLLETSIVASPERHSDLDELVAAADMVVAPFDYAQARVARDAYARYGKGSTSPAQLNFGDSIAYALAASTGEPLLFKGNDFTHTDVTPAR